MRTRTKMWIFGWIANLCFFLAGLVLGMGAGLLGMKYLIATFGINTQHDEVSDMDELEKYKFAWITMFGSIGEHRLKKCRCFDDIKQACSEIASSIKK